jgi:hypothetical protein
VRRDEIESLLPAFEVPAYRGLYGGLMHAVIACRNAILYSEATTGPSVRDQNVYRVSKVALLR